MIILYLITGLLFGMIISYILVKYYTNNEKLDNNIENKIARIAGEALKNNSEQFITLAKEVLGSEKKEIKTDLEGKKSIIAEMVYEIRKDIKKNEDRIEKNDINIIESFTKLKTELESYKTITGELKVSTEALKKILSNNQMRGQFGEQIADDLLKMSGFTIGKDYRKNEAIGEQGTRPDFTVYLPDRTKINIDAKFPFTALLSYSEAKSDDEKKKFLAIFKQDVKNKIKQVTSREYINPAENTVDFVIIFIPNEMIFSFIYEKMNDVWEEAMNKKVILSGPFSFTAILRMVKQSYTSFTYKENLHEIISLIHRFNSEFEKFSGEIDTLGARIKSLDTQFEVVSTTRTRQLTKIVDKITDKQVDAGDTAVIIDTKKIENTNNEIVIKSQI